MSVVAQRRDASPPYTGDILPLSFGGQQIVITNSVLLFITTAWVAMRLYSRRIRKVSIQVEDWVIIAALIGFYGFVVDSFLMVYVGGFGHHLSNLSPTQIERVLKLSFGSQILYAFTLCLTKCSICLMLIRIFFVPGFKIAAICAMVFAGLWGIMTVLIGLFICRPFAFNWDRTIPEGKCGNQNAAFASVGVIDILSDLVIMILPIPMVLNLHLPTANKIGLCSIFTFGLLTMVIGALRTVFAFKVNFADFTFSARIGHILSISEGSVAIIVASSPILRPLFDKIFHNLSSFGSRAQTYANSHQRSNIVGTSSNKRHLESMDDEVALNKLDDRHHAVTTFVSAGKPDSEFSVEADGSDKAASDTIRGIHVTTTVEHASAHKPSTGYQGSQARY